MANHVFDTLAAAGHDDAPFIEGHDGGTLTYGGMRRRVAQIAAALTALGVEPGDRVAAQIEKSVEGLLLFLGAMHAGAVFLPLNTAYTVSELDYFLADAEPRLVVCDPGERDAIAKAAAQIGAEVETLDDTGRGSLSDKVNAAEPASAPVDRGTGDLAAILYTSGTTGRSKGAMLTHANLVSNARTLAQVWRFTAADRLLHALPTYHIHGLFVAINTSLAAGSSLVFLPRFDVEAVIAALPRSTVMMGVPTFYTRLLACPRLECELTKAIRLFVSGSAPLLAETHAAWHARTGHAILERYGMTETNMNTSNPYDGERRPGTVGFPLPGVEVRIVDTETRGPLPPGETGMIEVKGPNVFKGYWRKPDKTAEDLREDGFFRTGDLGRFDSDGYVHIVGRDKDLVISGGFNVYPKEVELEIDAVDGVLESAVVGLPHKDYGEGVAAVVVKQAGADIDEAAIRHALTGRLAKYKQPKRILFVKELPRNAMGKVQKNVLRETHKALFAD